MAFITVGLGFFNLFGNSSSTEAYKGRIIINVGESNSYPVTHSLSLIDVLLFYNQSIDPDPDPDPEITDEYYEQVILLLRADNIFYDVAGKAILDISSSEDKISIDENYDNVILLLRADNIFYDVAGKGIYG